MRRPASGRRPTERNQAGYHTAQPAPIHIPIARRAFATVACLGELRERQRLDITHRLRPTSIDRKRPGRYGNRHQTNSPEQRAPEPDATERTHQETLGHVCVRALLQ